MEYKRIAHRGFSSQAPENTSAAFALAVEGDFYGVECDIWKCRDGVYVVSHDEHLKRMCGVDKKIPAMTWPEVSRPPIVGGKKKNEHPTQYIIRFTDYLSVMSRSDTIHPVVELKMRYTEEELREIVALVRRYGLFERTYFISMYREVLITLKEQLGFPPERLQYVYGVYAPDKWIPVNMELEQWLIQNRINLDTRYTLLSEGNVIRLHREGLQVNVWTVNKRDKIREMVEKCKVDMVTTEYYYE